MSAILVHIDLDGDRPHASSLIALAAGRHAASSWGATLYAALIAHDPRAPRAVESPGQVVTDAHVPGIEHVEDELARAGADKIVVALVDTPVAPLWGVVGAGWMGVLDHLRPRLVLFGADSPSAAELGPRTAARIGARLLLRARATGIDDVELRDRDGGYARSSDSGAAVALVGRAPAVPAADCDIDLVVLAVPGGDARVELAGATADDSAHACGVVVTLGDDVASDAQVAANARRLASMLAAPLVVGDRVPPISPELCVAIGTSRGDVAGATSVIKIGSQGGKHVDGALPGVSAAGLAELVKRLEGL